MNRIFELALLLLTASVATAGQTVESYKVNVLAGYPTLPARIDGVGEGARFESITAMWGDGANLYVADSTSIRRVELATSRVTTLAPAAGTGRRFISLNSGFALDFSGIYGLWGDGRYLYGTDIASGQIQKIDLITGGVETLADGLGLVWGLAARDTTVYAAATQTGLVMQVNLATGAKAQFANTGVGTPRQCFLGSGCIGYFVPGPRAAWSDGVNLYLSGYSGTIKQVDLTTGVQTLLPAVPFNIGPIAGVDDQLFVASISGSDLGSLRLDTGEFAPLLLPPINVNVRAISALWSDGSSLYFAQGPYLHGQVIRKIDLATGAVTTVAGVTHIQELVNVPNAVNAVGTSARFRTLNGIWKMGDVLYVTDRENSSIRRIEVASGAVTHVAGIPGVSVSVDGPSGTATFATLNGIWGDGDKLYVSEENRIRQISLSTGDVTTLAGPPGIGIDPSKTVYSPQGMWGANGKLYIADSTSYLIRQLDLASREVTTLTGALFVSDNMDGPLSSAHFRSPNALWGSDDVLYVGDSNAIRTISLNTGIVRTLATLPNSGPIRSVWGRGKVLYAAQDLPGSGPASTIYRIAIDTSEVSQVLLNSGGSGSGSLLSVLSVRGITGDSADLFLADGPNEVIWHLTPNAVPTTIQISNLGYSSQITAAMSSSISISHGQISATTGNATPAGMAIFALRQNGVLISEMTVPATHALRSGRISATTVGVVNTGIAIANPNSAAATIAFYFTDVSGRDYGRGMFTVAGGSQIARFITEPPFYGIAPIDGTLTFTSTIPVSAIALRGYINERSEFLMSTLPVIDLSRQFSNTPVNVTHFATGGGWSTEVVLINPTDQPISGSLQVVGTTVGFDPSPSYAVAPRASQHIRLVDSAVNPNTGAIGVIPQTGTAPSVICVFSFVRNGVRVTEAGVPDIPSGSAFRLYAETTPSPIGSSDSIRNGLAILNTANTAVDVNFEFRDINGESKGTGSLHIAAMSHVSLFVDELPKTGVVFANPGEMLRISSSLPTISVIGLRGRYNSRGDFLITTTPAIPEDNVPNTEPLYFPHIVNGGGYTTQFVFFGATSQPSVTSLGITTNYFDQSGTPIALPTR